MSSIQDAPSVLGDYMLSGWVRPSFFRHRLPDDMLDPNKPSLPNSRLHNPTFTLTRPPKPSGAPVRHLQ